MTPFAPVGHGHVLDIGKIFHVVSRLVVRHYYPIKKGYNVIMENMVIMGIMPCVCMVIVFGSIRCLYFLRSKKSPKGTYLAIDTLGDRSYLDFISVAAASPAARMPRPILPMRRSTDLVALAAPSATGAGLTSKEVLTNLDVNSIFIMSPIMMMGVLYVVYKLTQKKGRRVVLFTEM